MSRRTVFAGFTGKINLLKQAVDTVIVGDSADVPLAMRTAMHRWTIERCRDRIARALAALVSPAQRTPTRRKSKG